MITGNAKVITVTYAYPSCTNIFCFVNSNLHSKRGYYKSQAAVSIYYCG